jgi:hypothetical protein
MASCDEKILNILPMIVSHLCGGLGNQLFQFALGFTLSERHNTKLYFDISDFKYDAKRMFDLNVFPQITCSTINPNDLSLKLRPPSLFDRLLNLRKKALFKLQEKDYGYNSAILSSPDNVYLKGYWQSEKYFTSVSQKLKKVLTFPDFNNDEYSQIEQEINAGGVSVMLHIRRGDYVYNSHTNNIHGVLSIKYYQKAIQDLKKQISSFSVYVFTDDIEWVKSNRFFKNMNIISSEDAEAWEDMKLMTKCDHFILANSSFSWWGAWLGETSKSIVIAPRNWFRDKRFERSDKIPNRWKRL